MKYICIFSLLLIQHLHLLHLSRNFPQEFKVMFMFKYLAETFPKQLTKEKATNDFNECFNVFDLFNDIEII